MQPGDDYGSKRRFCFWAKGAHRQPASHFGTHPAFTGAQHPAPGMAKACPKKSVTGLTACPKKGFRKTDSLPLLHHISWLPSSLLRSGRRPHSMNDHQSPKPQRSRKATNHTTDARAAAQRAKLDAQTETIPLESVPLAPVGKQKKKKEPHHLLSDRRAGRTVEQAIGDYILDHEGGNRSKKTIEWHRTALRFLREFLAQERQITLVGEITGPDLTTVCTFAQKPWCPWQAS
jgi:hypothetical protein